MDLPILSALNRGPGPSSEQPPSARGARFLSLLHFSPARQKGQLFSEAAHPTPARTLARKALSIAAPGSGAGTLVWIKLITACFSKPFTEASVRIILCVELDPESCTDEQEYSVYQEDYPAIYTFDLSYDGSLYTVSRTYSVKSVKTADGPGRTFQYPYLICITEDSVLGTFAHHILANDNAPVTMDDVRLTWMSSSIETPPSYYSLFIELADPE